MKKQTGLALLVIGAVGGFLGYKYRKEITSTVKNKFEGKSAEDVLNELKKSTKDIKNDVKTLYKNVLDEVNSNLDTLEQVAKEEWPYFTIPVRKSDLEDKGNVMSDEAEKNCKCDCGVKENNTSDLDLKGNSKDFEDYKSNKNDVKEIKNGNEKVFNNVNTFENIDVYGNKNVDVFMGHNTDKSDELSDFSIWLDRVEKGLNHTEDKKVEEKKVEDKKEEDKKEDTSIEIKVKKDEKVSEKEDSKHGYNLHKDIKNVDKAYKENSNPSYYYKQRHNKYKNKGHEKD